MKVPPPGKGYKNGNRYNIGFHNNVLSPLVLLANAPRVQHAAAICLAFVVFGIASTGRASAQTIGQMLDDSCASAKAADAYEDRAHDALETGHIHQGNVYVKKASDLWYECTKETSDTYVHDWAAYFHALDLWRASYSNTDPWAVIACSDLNQLAYVTRFDDVRAASLSLKQKACNTS